MHLSNFLRLSTAYYRSGKCIYLTSAPGRGKTTTILAAVPKIASDLGKNMGVVVISGPLLTPADAVGYLVPVKMDDGTVESKYTTPFWFRTDEGKALSEYDGGIIFVDEADKMDMDVKKIVGEMALSGRCGPHHIPKGWVVWMAGNRAGDRSGSTKELDHLINRRFEVPVTDDLAGWEKWALKNGVHHSIIAFAMQNANIVFPDALPDKQGPFCTPRSLVATGELLAYLAGSDGTTVVDLPTDTDAIEIASGGIGQAAAAQLFATLRLEADLPKTEDIIADPMKAKLPAKIDAQMLVAYKLSHMVTYPTLGPIIKYVQRLPADLQVTFVKSLCVRDPMAVSKPELLAWIKANSAIMAVITSLR